MTKKSLIIWLLIVAFLWTIGFLYSKWDNVPTEAKKTEKELYIDMKAEHAWYEYELMKVKEQERFFEQKEQEAREKVKWFWGTGFQQ